MVEIIKVKCQFCDHEWQPRVPEPKWCPFCHKRIVEPKLKKKGNAHS